MTIEVSPEVVRIETQVRSRVKETIYNLREVVCIEELPAGATWFSGHGLRIADEYGFDLLLRFACGGQEILAVRLPNSWAMEQTMSALAEAFSEAGHPVGCKRLNQE